ncbi:MAG: Uma2 family endonuclease [Acidobacteria bacterium]|nr:Uma2 family endonuclease [Acidobacteriota bacterium]
MTVDEYLRRTPDAAGPMELIYGMLRVAESPPARHQSAVADLFRAIDRHVRERGLGQVCAAPVDVVLNVERALVLQPDLLFVSNARAAILKERVHGAPDLMIDVLSPEPRIGRTEERVQWCAESGVRECWFVHQDLRSIAIFRFAYRRIGSRVVHGRQDPIASAVLPDLGVCLDDILLAE